MNSKINIKSKTALIMFLFISICFMPIISGDDAERNNNLIINIENIELTRIQITAEIPAFDFSTVELDDQFFTEIELVDAGILLNEGQAKLPMIRKMIEIPQGSIPQIMISDTWETVTLLELGLPSRIVPTQPSQEKEGDDNDGFVIDDKYYNTDQFFPQETVQISEINQIRGRRFALIEIAPICYNPLKGEVQLLISSDISIDLSKGFNFDATIDSIERYSSPDFEDMYQHIFTNYGYYENLASENKDPEGFLIIVHDAFNDEITPLANWKTTMGYDTTVTLTSSIPGGATANNIKSYIETAYTTWSPPPSYILLVGDTPQIPAHTGPTSYAETDSLFVRMDGDIFADIFIGRFPADNESQVDAMVDKTIFYEQGNFPSIDWIKKAAFIASDDASLTAEYTHNYCIDNHMTPNGYTSDKIYETLGGTTSDITNALNEGRSLCIYSGHGYSEGWSCIPFNNDDVYELDNDGM